MPTWETRFYSIQGIALLAFYFYGGCMIEDRQEINGMLVLMDQKELDMVKMFCRTVLRLREEKNGG